MENEPDHENVEQSLCAKTTEEELNKSFNLEASLSKFSYIDLDKELEFKNDLVKIQLFVKWWYLTKILVRVYFMTQNSKSLIFAWTNSLCTVLWDNITLHLYSSLQFMKHFNTCSQLSFTTLIIHFLEEDTEVQLC